MCSSDLGLVRALTGLGDLERGVERTDAAATAYASARTLAQQLNDPAADAALLVGLADIERTRGGSTAAALAQQARERANSPAGQASALVLQARIALQANDLAVAERALAEAQQALGQTDDPVVAQALLAVADVQRAKGDAGALESYRKALAAFEANGTRLGEAWALLGLGKAQGTASPIEAKVNLLLAGNLFAALGMEARRAEATAAAAAIN